MLSQQQINFLIPYMEGIVWHHTAGRYYQTFPSYHFHVTYDGKLAHVRQTKSLYEVGAHVWKRNTGKIGITFSAMYTNPKTGKIECPVEDHQVEVMAKLTAELCIKLDIDPFGQHLDNEKRLQNGTLVNTGKMIQCPNITDHAWYARQDGYYPDRWDIGNLKDVVYRKTIWYYQKLKMGKIPFEYTNDLK